MAGRLRRLLFGAPRDVRDKRIFHSISLVAMLAWVGLGADGLSSSAYGPDEAYKELVRGGAHQASFAVFLALGTAITVFIISYAYTRIIEQFPGGGGGYIVASKLLGPKFGVVSGSALLVDYVLTITTSIASGGDAIFSMIPRSWFGQTEVLDAAGALERIVLADRNALLARDVGGWLDPVQRTKLLVEITAIVVLTALNLRGVKESVRAIVPVFATFVVTHVILFAVAFGAHVGDTGAVVTEVRANIGTTVSSLGALGALGLFVRVYSLGGGTYTGIEAVSNGTQIMREPRVRTAKRTMILMASSLAITAGGILLCYLLTRSMPAPGKTMNAVLLENVAGSWTLGSWRVGPWFVLLALASEAGLLFVAAQAGFVDGPRVMANMAIDSWLPRRFAALSDRLSMQNGVLLMSAASVTALLYTHGNVTALVTMYAINVFLTFSLSNLGMSRFWIQSRTTEPGWYKHLPVHLVGLGLCLTILVVTCVEKFREGGWLTLAVTGALVAVCVQVKRHYRGVSLAIQRLDKELPDPLPASGVPEPVASVRVLGAEHASQRSLDAARPIVVLFVGGYGALGRRALLTLLRMFPRHFGGVVFCSIAVLDSGNLKGEAELEELEARTRAELEKYVRFAKTEGLPAEAVFALGTEVAVEAEKIGTELIAKYPLGLVVAGQLVFDDESWVTGILHNETAFMIQRRMQHAGIPMVVLPVRISPAPGAITRESQSSLAG